MFVTAFRRDSSEDLAGAPKRAPKWVWPVIWISSLLVAVLTFPEGHAERFRVVSLRGSVRVYFPNGEKERGARGQILETDQRWVVEKDSGLYLEGDLGSKISFINSGVLFFRKSDSAKGWQLEVSGRELYVSLSAQTDLTLEAPQLKTDSTPVEFYYETQDEITTVQVLLGELTLAGDEESVPMKSLVIEDGSVDPRPFNRSDFFRLQRRHENNALGRDPERPSLKLEQSFLPWRLTLTTSGLWSHLLPENGSSFSQDKFGWNVSGQLTREFLLRRPPSPNSLAWMPRLRLGPYVRVTRPGWQLAPTSAAAYHPLVREFGLTGGLAWDGFFLMAQIGYVDYSSPFTSHRPLSLGALSGLELTLSASPALRVFWQAGLYVSHTYVEIDRNEATIKGVSNVEFRSLNYGFLTGPSVAF